MSVYVRQWFNHLCIIPCFIVFSKVVAIFSKSLPTCLTWSCWKYMNNTKCKISQPVHVSHHLTTAKNIWIVLSVKPPTCSRPTWSFYSWKYMNSTKCKISQPPHVSHDLTSAENIWITQNVKYPNLYTYHLIFPKLKLHE